MKRGIIFVLLSAASFEIADSQQWTNFRIHPSGGHQIEPSAVRHQTNPLIMFVAAYTIRGSFRNEGYYVTTDGGNTWYGSDTLASGTQGFYHGGDPGPIIDKNGRFILTHIGNTVAGMFSNYSTDMGITWSSPATSIWFGDVDKGSPTTNDVPSSPYYGRTYLAWTRYSAPFPIIISWTDNGAESWTSPAQINSSPGGHVSYGPYAAVGAAGEIMVSWASAFQTSPFTEDCIGFGRSDNGGTTWNVQECAYDVNGIKSTSLAPWGIRVNGYPYMDVDKTGGSRNGWIYIVEAEKNLAPAGSDPDIIFHRSTNGGQTWSVPGVRVNQDALNNGKVQLFPAIHVDAGGGINVIYLDNRSGPGDSMAVYLSRSADGGNSWSDYRVSDHWFWPQAVSGTGTGNQGDNLGITSANGKLWPMWMDKSTGTYQIWTAAIEIATIGIKQINSEVPDRFGLGQNYPNPFNQLSIINFSIGPSGQLSIESQAAIRVYDSKGSEVKVLYEGQLKPGTYQVQFDGANLPSGVYFYRLTTPKYSETRKMVLTK